MTAPPPWRIRDRTFAWGSRTYLMGVLNVTPDSFSDGGLHVGVDAALAAVDRMLPYVDMVDVGGESTRPGAEPVSLDEERRRVLPVVVALRQRFPELPISVDTTKSLLAADAIAAGADAINDVSAARFDPQMWEVAARSGMPLMLMHMQGEPRTMQRQPFYRDVVSEVRQFLADAVYVAAAMGIGRDRLMVDPGIGFGKSLDHNLQLLRSLPALRQLGCPVLVGVSRKSFIGTLCDRPAPQDRLWGTAAACTIAIAGGADMLRVHDVREMADVCRVADAVYRN